MKSIKDNSEIIFTERKTRRNKDQSVSRYGIIKQVKPPVIMNPPK